MPCGVYRRTRSGTSIYPQHPVHRIVHDIASPLQTSMELWETVVASLQQWGNAYLRPTRDASGSITGLVYMRPDRMDVHLDRKTGHRYYGYHEPDGTVTPYTDYDILHIPGLGFDGIRGYSPVELLRESIGAGLAAEEYQARFFGNNMVPPHYLAFPGTLGPKARENLIRWYKQNFGGLANAHKLGVVEQGGEIKTVPINHRDIQFLELRKFQLEDIARIYGTPLHLIQSLDRATFNNIEHLSIMFVTHTIRPLAVRIEQRVNAFLFREQDAGKYFVRFNLAGLLRGDAASRAEYHSKMISSALETPNEGRAKEDLPPLPGGDRLYIQGAMVPLPDAAPPKKEAKNA